LCIGTSGVVYPAASFPLYAKEKGAVVINVNPHDSSVDEIADFCIRSPAVSFFENLSLHL
jgi:NAD-dependent deacetylase